MTVSPEIVVDLAAIRHNVRLLRDLVAPAALMTVVKADGYGHGRSQVAQAAREGGADWLGVATVAEALALRAGGDRGPLLCWLTMPGDDLAAALAADVELTAYTIGELELIARTGGPGTRVQLKIDTGLSRGGAAVADWAALGARAAELEGEGAVEITGVWSHLAAADEPDHPANDLQQQRFEEAVEVARRAGLRPGLCHLANSAASILRPGVRYDLARCGIASYGLDPAPGHTPPDLGLVPAMTVRAPLVLTKDIAAGEGVSYGHRWTAAAETFVGLVPLGYGDGIPRHASDRAEVAVDGVRHPVRGTVCMDQFVIDLGEQRPEIGAEVVLFGPGTGGEPTAQDWASVAGTINYEIVTRIGGRLTRRYVDSQPRAVAP